MSDYKLVSSDSHIMEPPDLWLKHIDPEYKERAPHVVREGDYDQWYADGDIKFGIVGSNTQAGRRFEAPETIQSEGTYEEVRLGGMDPHAHVTDMDLDTVDGGVIFPSMGLTTWVIPSSDLLSAVFRAYNDWLAIFCEPYPKRLKGLAMLNVDSVEEGVRELRRSHKIGLAGAMIPQKPVFGRYDNSMYTPLWEAAQELDMPLAIHIGTSRWTPAGSPTHGPDKGLIEFTNQEYDMKDNVTAILYSCLFEDYPDLQHRHCRVRDFLGPLSAQPHGQDLRGAPPKVCPAVQGRRNAQRLLQEQHVPQLPGGRPGYPAARIRGCRDSPMGFRLPSRRVHLPQVPRNRRPHP